MKALMRPVRVVLSGLIALNTLAGCTTSQIIQETDRTANDAIFRHNAAAKWEPEAAGPLKLPDVSKYVDGLFKRVAAHAKTPGRYTSYYSGRIPSYNHY